ncbi:hypothetical protein SmJEL517_g01035 [Synchytrium microbalum]|uniref:DH domain-containing protein n=1 Tax=Synchytrium microbalum TaxID=1806994 RepID=A0A507CGN0_9FUNG|nr:uncharacterized protein SmJEL517_g01035 [Synchytrium microbalum]TPX37144.1 hypothetical protein SmJEL517_g01035 [Synchytrium microbalum]
MLQSRPPSVFEKDDEPFIPALLSHVARYFRRDVPLSTHTKDMVNYKDSFTGKEAVEVLCKMLNTKDRGLALIVGRALQAQRFFHDVTYNNTLRDSTNEQYKFESALAPLGATDSQDSTAPSAPTGVLTYLANCYSPTCGEDCYSETCRQKRENKRVGSQQLERSETSFFGDDELFVEETEFWSTSVSQEIRESVSENERKRQEAIFEIIAKEREYVADLELVKNTIIHPLRESMEIFPTATKEKIITDMFLNMEELFDINFGFLRKLVQRQRTNPVVDAIGDIFLSMPSDPVGGAYMYYGSNQVFAENTYRLERAQNPSFNNFIEAVEREPALRKLSVLSFLGRPTQRMGRYILLLEGVLKRTPENHPDVTAIPRARDSIKALMHEINIKTGEAVDALKLKQLSEQLSFKRDKMDMDDLRLTEPGRKILREGQFMYRKETGVKVQLTVFLFDHLLLMAKERYRAYGYKVHKMPIPLELLVLPSESSVAMGGSKRASGRFGSPIPSKGSLSDVASFTTSSSKSMSSKASSVTQMIEPTDATKFPFTFAHLGRPSVIYTLYSNTEVDRLTWRDAIQTQQDTLLKDKKVFDLVVLDDGGFRTSNRVLSSAVFGRKLVLGTEKGLYIGEDGSCVAKVTTELPSAFTKILDLDRITQVDVLIDFNIVLVLQGREGNLLVFPLSLLDTPDVDLVAAAATGQRVDVHIAFFKVGVSLDKTLVCTVKTQTLQTTIKVLEPIQTGKKKKGRWFLSGSNDALKVYQEFYIPADSTSIHFLKTKICVGCNKGFEVIDLTTLDTIGLLDPQDASLDFVLSKDALKPMSMFRLKDGEFLLCYDEFGFYVDRLGRRSRPDVLVNWTGCPTSFAYSAPYLLAFDPSFIEVRNALTGQLQQIIPATSLRSLATEPDRIHGVMSNPFGNDIVFAIRPIASS